MQHDDGGLDVRGQYVERRTWNKPVLQQNKARRVLNEWLLIMKHMKL